MTAVRQRQQTPGRSDPTHSRRSATELVAVMPTSPIASFKCSARKPVRRSAAASRSMHLVLQEVGSGWRYSIPLARRAPCHQRGVGRHDRRDGNETEHACRRGGDLGRCAAPRCLGPAAQRMGHRAARKHAALACADRRDAGRRAGPRGGRCNGRVARRADRCRRRRRGSAGRRARVGLARASGVRGLHRTGVQRRRAGLAARTRRDPAAVRARRQPAAAERPAARSASARRAGPGGAQRHAARRAGRRRATRMACRRSARLARTRLHHRAGYACGGRLARAGRVARARRGGGGASTRASDDTPREPAFVDAHAATRRRALPGFDDGRGGAGSAIAVRRALVPQRDGVQCARAHRAQRESRRAHCRARRPTEPLRPRRRRTGLRRASRACATSSA